MTLVPAGMACGLALAVPMAFAMRATFVAKVTASDPMVFLPTISVLLVVGILAAAVPAVRASRIDPIATLLAGIAIAFATVKCGGERPDARAGLWTRAHLTGVRTLL